LISFNKSIDFVQQFHWIRSTIPLILLRKTGGFVVCKRHFEMAKAAQQGKHLVTI